MSFSADLVLLLVNQSWFNRQKRNNC